MKEKIELSVAIASGILIPIILYFLAKKNWGQKKYLLSKFDQNKEKVRLYTIDLRKLLSYNNAWNSIMFKEQNITYKEFLEVMEEKYNVEYSNEQSKALRNKKLSKFEIEEYISKLKVQEDSLNLMRQELDLLIKKFSQ